MTQEERTALFTRALWEAARRRATEPDNRILHSIEHQLYYLIGVVRGTLPGDRLDEVNIGLLAVREMEGRDDQLCKLLYACSAEVRVMETEKPRAAGLS